MSEQKESTINEKRACVWFYFAETPVHAGEGNAGEIVDLPIQRSVWTEWPVWNDGTLRGGLRDLVRRIRGEATANAWFGIEGKEAGGNPHPGRIATPDAEILLFPVASAKGTVAWVTCVAALRSFARKLEMFQDGGYLSGPAEAAAKGIRSEAARQVPACPDNQARVADVCELIWKRNRDGNEQEAVILDSDCFEIAGDKTANELAKWLSGNTIPLGKKWREYIEQRIVVLGDDAFQHYVRTRTDVRTRNRISEGRAANTALWTEESLPVNTLMYSVLFAPDAAHNSALSGLRKLMSECRVFQLGGDQNLGRGFVRVRELGEAPWIGEEEQ